MFVNFAPDAQPWKHEARALETPQFGINGVSMQCVSTTAMTANGGTLHLLEVLLELFDTEMWVSLQYFEP